MSQINDEDHIYDKATTPQVQRHYPLTNIIKHIPTKFNEVCLFISPCIVFQDIIIMRYSHFMGVMRCLAPFRQTEFLNLCFSFKIRFDLV